jgi:hypothetical protein
LEKVLSPLVMKIGTNTHINDQLLQVKMGGHAYDPTFFLCRKEVCCQKLLNDHEEIICGNKQVNSLIQAVPMLN